MFPVTFKSPLTVTVPLNSIPVFVILILLLPFAMITALSSTASFIRWDGLANNPGIATAFVRENLTCESSSPSFLHLSRAFSQKTRRHVSPTLIGKVITMFVPSHCGNKNGTSSISGYSISVPSDRTIIVSGITDPLQVIGLYDETSAGIAV